MWLKNDDLIVRSYQGPVACQKLRPNGVCWTAVKEDRTVIVDNVNEFPGHIACNPNTKSEIVVPLKDKEGKIFGCFDVDSINYNTFDADDEKGIKMILDLIYL